MQKRILVTGGAGFIGSNLVKRLIADGHKVDIVDDLSSGKFELLQGLEHKTYIQSGTKPLWWEVLQGESCLEQDVRSPSSNFKLGKLTVLDDDNVLNVLVSKFDAQVILERIKTGIYDVVFHEAAIPRVSYSMEQPAQTTDNNVAATVHLLEACRDNVRRFVFASSSSVYGGAAVMPTAETSVHQPKSPYALQKSVCEQFIRLFCEIYGMDAICLRYFNVFGPGQFGDSAYSTAVSAWCNAIAHDLPLRSDGDGSQTRDMCYIDNVVEANILAANSTASSFKGEAYNIACGDRVSNKEILNYLQTKFQDLTIEHAPWRPGDVHDTLADINAAEKAFGYRPIVQFWEGLERTIKWWKL